MIYLESGAFWGVIGGLLAFGVLYNSIVGWLSSQGYDEGYVALLVAAGVLGTLVGVAMISWEAAVLALVCFAVSGTPMIVGSVWRHMQARQRASVARAQEAERMPALIVPSHLEEEYGD